MVAPISSHGTPPAAAAAALFLVFVYKGERERTPLVITERSPGEEEKKKTISPRVRNLLPRYIQLPGRFAPTDGRTDG